MYMRQPQKRKSICSGEAIYWIILIALAITCLACVISLQGHKKENQMLKWRLEQAGSQRVHERNLLHNRLSKLEKEMIQVEKEKEDVLTSHKATNQELRKAREDAQKLGSFQLLEKQLEETETRLLKAEKEIKEITVKAGTCQREFANLNANYETVKQDVNNFASQELSSAKVGKAEKAQQSAKIVKAGELDPRGGMEAAKVLNEELPESETVSNKLQTEQKLDTDFLKAHPLKIGAQDEKYDTGLETSEGLEREALTA